MLSTIFQIIWIKNIKTVKFIHQRINCGKTMQPVKLIIHQTVSTFAADKLQKFPTINITANKQCMIHSATSLYGSCNLGLQSLPH